MPLGKDLAYIRKSQNLTLEDIQNAIKIPVSTLESIEDESIFHERAENQTYRRSFIRSYAKVLKIDTDKIIKALDAMEAGTYNHDLLPERQKDIETETEEIVSSDNIEKDEDEVKEDETIEPTPVPPSTPAPSPSISDKPRPNQPPELSSVNWADMGRKFSPVGRNSRTILVLFIVVCISLLAGAGYIFSDEIADLFNSNSTPAEELSENAGQSGMEPAPLDSVDLLTEAESDRTQAEEGDISANNRESIVLGDTLTVAVYAAYGQLEPVRVTSDLNWRTNPYWMEEGDAYYFDFQDTLLVRGQYSRMVLLFNGHPIEDPRQNHFNSANNSVMITRSVLNQSKYLAAAPEEFPLEVGEPDSIIYRVRF